jgi:transposase InsO family protein
VKKKASAKVGESSKTSPKGNPHPNRSGSVSGPKHYEYEIKRRAVQLCLEEGLTIALVATELGVNKNTIHSWLKLYRNLGEAGLRRRLAAGNTSKVSAPVKERIVQLKAEDPTRGVKKISQLLRRLFCLPASPETVRRHLKDPEIKIPKVKAKKKSKPPERRFESATPNQMWQTDITYFQVLGKTAYIIGFIDDHSRYITGLGVFWSQTSENVVETYRSATGQFGVPKEMLTDNGRQYASWHGITKFQKELKRDRVHHIRSQPHHPQTLGKIERFWKSLKDEFLSRARFETFDSARERIAYWVKYYNHKRPHQGLDGMTPADRYFSIQNDVKAAIERGVAANIEELALRGKPEEPFYMVGRVGDRSVVIETDKKRVSVMLDGQEMSAGQSMTYERKERSNDEAGTVGNNSNGNKEAEKQGSQREGEDAGSAVVVERKAEHGVADKGTGGAVGNDQQLGEEGSYGNADGAGSDVAEREGGTAGTAEAVGEVDRKGSGTINGDGRGCKVERKEQHEDNGAVRSSGEKPGSAGCVDGPEDSGSAVPGNGSERNAILPVAGSGAFGYIGGAGATQYEGRIRGTGASGADQAVAGPQDKGPGVVDAGPQYGLAGAASEAEDAGSTPGCRELLNKEVSERDGRRPESRETHAGDPGSSCRAIECNGSLAGAGNQPKDLLLLAGAGQVRNVPGTQGQADRPSSGSGGSGEGSTAGKAEDLGKGAGCIGIQAAIQGSHPGSVLGHTRERCRD